MSYHHYIKRILVLVYRKIHLLRSGPVNESFVSVSCNTHESHSQSAGSLEIRVDAKAPDGQMMMVMIHSAGI